jgi:hypothetical protein
MLNIIKRTKDYPDFIAAVPFKARQAVRAAKGIADASFKNHKYKVSHILPDCMQI